MPKKLKYDFIMSSFVNSGYVLLSSNYINSGTPLEYRCDKGHIHKIRWSDWKKGVRCPECQKTFNLKYRDTVIKESLLEEGYRIVSGEIVNGKSLITIECPQKHIYINKVLRWMSGYRCPYCSNRLSFEERISRVKKSLLEENYVFEGVEDKKIKYICPEGHRHTVYIYDWVDGYRCPHCSGNARKNIQDIEKNFIDNGYILKSNKYDNCYTKLEYICPEGHEGTVTWNDWNDGCRCHKCAYIKNSIRITGAGHPNWQGGISCEPYCQDWTKAYKEYIKERDNYTCLNPYCSKDCNALSVHHINYNKKDCSSSNLITICKSCNSKANKDREWHEAWYKAIIYRRYLK